MGRVFNPKCAECGVTLRESPGTKFYLFDIELLPNGIPVAKFKCFPCMGMEQDRQDGERGADEIAGSR